MDELERFKSEIDLVLFATARGYRVDRRESSRACAVLRHPITDDKIVVSRARRDRHWIYFSVRDPRDHGSIVDFVQRRDGGTLGSVRRELAAWSGARPPTPTEGAIERSVEPRVADRALVARAFARARAGERSSYLKSRGISTSILSSVRFAGTFREDARGNALFPHTDTEGLSGFESKNRGWTSFASGGVRTLWRSNAFTHDTALVLVESAIDALSFHQVHDEPTFRYASTAGSLSPHQRSCIAEAVAALPASAALVLAYDRDPAGDRLAEQVRDLSARPSTRVYPPHGKDWNDYLQRIARVHRRDVPRALGRDRDR
jgi:hypothetical protein